MVDGPRGFGRSMGMSQTGLADPCRAHRSDPCPRAHRSERRTQPRRRAGRQASPQPRPRRPAGAADRCASGNEGCGAPERHTGPIASPPRSHPYRSSKGRACPGEPPRRLRQRGKAQSRGTFATNLPGAFLTGADLHRRLSAGRTSKALASTRRISKAPTTTQAHSGPRASIRTAPRGRAPGR